MSPLKDEFIQENEPTQKLLLTAAPLGPGNPITPAWPLAPGGPAGPGRPS